MPNTRTKLGPEGEKDRIGDPDLDLSGTYPGSTPHPSDLLAVPAARVTAEVDALAPHSEPPQVHHGHRPNTTKDQWRRESHDPQGPPEYDPLTDPARRAARQVLSSVSRSGSNLNQSGPRPGTLLDPNDRPVVSSMAMPLKARLQFVDNNPGYKVVPGYTVVK
jgi:hypothetical protein